MPPPLAAIMKQMRIMIARTQDRFINNSICTENYQNVDGRPPLLFSWAARRGKLRTPAALERARENYRTRMGTNPEPCLLMCDGCAKNRSEDTETGASHKRLRSE